MSEGSRPLEIELTFRSSTEYLSLIRKNVGWICEKKEFPEKECSRTVLAVVEAATNIIRHAYEGDPDSTITLRLAEIDCGLQIEFLDRGKEFSPDKLQGRDLDDVKPGGLGLHMLRACMDDVRFEKRSGGGTRLVLRKIVEKEKH